MEISINEENVYNIINDVLIEEDIISTHSKLKLTKDQIINELTNLLYDFYKNNITSKVNSILDIFDKKYSSLINLPILYPVIDYIKYEYYDDKEKDNIDNEYGDKNQISYIYFYSLLRQVNDLLKSTNSYVDTKKRLDILFKPILTQNSNFTNSFNIDAFRYYNNNIVKQPIRILSNDNIKVVGFLSKPKDINDNITYFDVSKYIQNIENLNINDNVLLIFKDFILDNSKTPLIKEIVKVTDITDTNITFTNNLNIKFIYDKININLNKFFIYIENEFIYSTDMLLTKNIYFYNYNIELIQKIFLPQNISQYIFMNLKEVKSFKNLNDLDNLLYDINHNSRDLDVSITDLLRFIVEKRYPNLIISKNPKFNSINLNSLKNDFVKNINHPYKSSYIDSDISRYIYIHSSLALEYSYILSQIDNYFKNFNEYILLNNKNKDLLKLSDKIQKEIKLPIKDSKCDNIVNNSEIKIFDTYIQLEKSDYNGHKAIVRELSGDTIYIKSKVSNGYVWKKDKTIPFKLCQDDLYTNLDIEKTDTCIFDIIKNKCNEIPLLRENIKQFILKEKYDNIQEAIEIIDNLNLIQEKITEIKKYFDNLLLLPYNKNYNILTKNTKIDEDDIDDYEGDINFDEKELILTHDEEQQYAQIFNKKVNKEDQENINSYSEILYMFINFMNIDLKQTDIDFILKDVETKYPYTIDSHITKFYNTLFSKRNADLYNIDNNYKTKFDNLIETKLTAEKNKLIGPFYYNIISRISALLALIIMTKYPSILIGSIYPACLQFFTYKGYPIDNNQQKNLIKYLSCLITHVTSTNDSKYSTVSQNKVDDIYKNISTEIDQILQQYIHIDLALKNNKDKLILKNLNHNIYNETYYGFRPSFEFNNPNNKIIKFLKKLNHSVETSKVLKTNIFNIPALHNTCCLEKLKDNIVFFDHFINESTNIQKEKIYINTPNINVKLNNYNIKQGNIIFNNINFINSTNSKPFENINKIILNFKEKNKLYSNDPIFNKFEEIDFNNLNKKFWDDTVYNKIINLYNIIINTISNYISVDKIKVDLIKQFIYVQAYNDINNLRYGIFKNITTSFQSFLAKTASIKNINIENYDNINDNIELTLLLSIIKNKNFSQDLIKNIINISLNDVKTLWFQNKTIENIILLNYIFLKICYSILNKFADDSWNNYDIYNNINVNNNIDLDRFKLVCSLIYTSLIKYYNDIYNIDTNIKDITQQNEVLREKRKQDLMDKYKVDDEERSLQIELRKLGYANWQDVGVNIQETSEFIENTEKDIYPDKEQPIINKEEEENYKLNDYAGHENENNDVEDLDEPWFKIDN